MWNTIIGNYSFRKHRRARWDNLYRKHHKFFQRRRPFMGWIREARLCLVMSLDDIAKRMGVTRQAIIFLEKREKNGNITVAKLKAVVQAMDCELVYYFIPKQDFSFEKKLLNRVRGRVGVHLTSRKIWKSE